MSKSKVNTHRQALEQRERMRKKRDRIDGLRELMRSWEDVGNIYEARRVQVKLRLAQQELRYMGETDDYPNEVEFNLIEKRP
jgi:hypothetical protein